MISGDMATLLKELKRLMPRGCLSPIAGAIWGDFVGFNSYAQVEEISQCMG